MKNKHGFTIVAALALAAMLAGASLIVMGLRRMMDGELRALSVRHGMDILEDIVRSQITIEEREMTDPDQFVSYVQAFNGPNFRFAIDGSNCATPPAKSPCYLHVLEQTFYSDTNAVVIITHPLPATMTIAKVIMKIGVDPTDAIKMQSKVAPLALEIPIPTQSEIKQNDAVSSNSLICQFPKPIFKGTKKNTDGSISPICESLALDASKSTLVSQTSSMQVTCKTNQGRWMSSVSGNIQPDCLQFPDGTKAQPTAQLCDDGKVARSYELGANFQIINLTCVNRGGPYSFSEKATAW